MGARGSDARVGSGNGRWARTGIRAPVVPLEVGVKGLDREDAEGEEEECGPHRGRGSCGLQQSKLGVPSSRRKAAAEAEAVRLTRLLKAAGR